jgi:hypothetical protein
MIPAFQLLISLSATGVCWMWLRQTVRAGRMPAAPRAAMIDVMPVVGLWTLLTAITIRPISTAALVAFVSACLVKGNSAKILASGEPLVFTDLLLVNSLWDT